MLLATGSTFDFMQFLQIISWILIPALVIAVSVTIFFHYRKKKEKGEDDDLSEKLVMGSPEIVGYTKGDGEFVCFDHSPLISQYKNQLTYTHARFSALHHDFEKLATSYQALAGFAIAQFTHKSENFMGNTLEHMPKKMQQEVNRLAATFNSEKADLISKLNQLNQSFKSLEEENQFLQEQVSIKTATGEEKDAIVAKWREENKVLKDKVAEQQYLYDVLDEKKAQIEFLQDKLEQRVRNQYEVEHERSILIKQLEEARHEQQLACQLENNLKKELLHKQEEADKLQVVLCGKEEQLIEQAKLLAAKEDHIKRLEALMSEMREKEAGLNTLLTESREQLTVLQQVLTEQQQKKEFPEQNTVNGMQAPQKIYSELSSIANGEGQSPVISLNPAYISNPDDEIAVH